MVFIEPCGLIGAQESEEVAAAEFGARGFDEEGAAAARAYGGVDLGDEVVGEDDVCSLCAHRYVPLLL